MAGESETPAEVELPSGPDRSLSPLETTLEGVGAATAVLSLLLGLQQLATRISDDRQERRRFDFILASLQEAAGRREAALEAFESLRPRLTPGRAMGVRTDSAIRRLSGRR